MCSNRLQYSRLCQGLIRTNAKIIVDNTDNDNLMMLYSYYVNTVGTLTHPQTHTPHFNHISIVIEIFVQSLLQNTVCICNYLHLRAYR